MTVTLTTFPSSTSTSSSCPRATSTRCSPSLTGAAIRDDLVRMLNYLADRGPNDRQTVMGKDFAPWSFTFQHFRGDKPWINGGLIYYGPGDTGFGRAAVQRPHRRHQGRMVVPHMSDPYEDVYDLHLFQDRLTGMPTARPCTGTTTRPSCRRCAAISTGSPRPESNAGPYRLIVTLDTGAQVRDHTEEHMIGYFFIEGGSLWLDTFEGPQILIWDIVADLDESFYR